MNKIFLFACCILFSMAVLISSCSKKLDEPGFPGFRCAFGNSEYIADTAYYTKSLGTTIYATKGSTYIRIYLVRADTTGTFSLDSITNTAYYYDGTKTFRSSSGTLAISQYFNDSLAVMSGSFNFNSVVPGSSGESLNFTYGYFNNIPRH